VTYEHAVFFKFTTRQSCHHPATTIDTAIDGTTSNA